MAPTVLHLNYSHFIPNFSSSPPLLLPLSLLLPLHVQCHCVSKCLCVGAAALPVTSCAFASVWRHRRPEHFGLCSDITTEPQWTKATSLIVSKVYRWLQTQAFLHNKGACGLVGSVERRPHVNAPTASSLRQIKVTKLSVGTVIYRPSLCLPLPLFIHDTVIEWGVVEDDSRHIHDAELKVSLMCDVTNVTSLAASWLNHL